MFALATKLCMFQANETDFCLWFVNIDAEWMRATVETKVIWKLCELASLVKCVYTMVSVITSLLYRISSISHHRQCRHRTETIGITQSTRWLSSPRQPSQSKSVETFLQIQYLTFFHSLLPPRHCSLIFPSNCFLCSALRSNLALSPNRGPLCCSPVF